MIDFLIKIVRLSESAIPRVFIEKMLTKVALDIGQVWSNESATEESLQKYSLRISEKCSRRLNFLKLG